MNVLEVSVVLNVTVAGTAEWSAEVAPPLRITVRGMLTDVAGALGQVDLHGGCSASLSGGVGGRREGERVGLVVVGEVDGAGAAGEVAGWAGCRS